MRTIQVKDIVMVIEEQGENAPEIIAKEFNISLEQASMIVYKIATAKWDYNTLIQFD